MTTNAPASCVSTAISWAVYRGGPSRRFDPVGVRRYPRHVSTILALGPTWLDPNTIVTNLGSWALWGVMGIIFAECGLLIGFFMPGDSLLFIVGMFVSRGVIPHSLWFVAVCLVVAAVVGNLVGYGIGRKAGPAIFNRPDSRLFKRSYVEKTHAFFERHGGRAIVLARFVPVVRTFITVTAGVAKMPFRSYAVYSSIGAVIWAAGVTVLGYSSAGSRSSATTWR